MLHLQQYYANMLLLKMQVHNTEDFINVKKIISIAIIMGFASMNIAPLAVFADEQNITMPKQFKSMVKKNKKTGDGYKYAYINYDWWNDNFNDEILSGYIDKALKNNYDLKVATLTVDEYYQNTRLQFANELPSATVGFMPGISKAPGMTKTSGTFAVPGIVSYEVDLFLKNRDKTKSTKKLWEGAKLDERAAYISIASAVGSTYLNIVKMDKLIDLQKEIVSSRKDIYDLMTLRNQEGITSTADVVRAQKAYVSGNSDLIDLQRDRAKLLHQLCVLIGESPENASTIQRISYDNLDFTAPVPSEISSEVIMNRPDYLKAEIMVEKAGIDVRVARKEFLPTINLGGLAFFNSSNFGSIFSTKEALLALGGGALLPLFTGGKKFANLRLSKDKYEKTLNSYYQTNLTAIQEVNDSLVTLKLDNEKLKKNELQKSLEEKDFGYTERRYEQGIISKLDLIQQKENLLTINKLVAQNKVDCMIDHIGLYKAVGSKI